MPLDRSGTVPGTLSLSVERKLAGPTPSRSAVIALAGGPGQAALPLSAFIARAIAPALGSRDLLLFDQRGTGTSDPLSCPALESPSAVGSVGRVYERCAVELGPVRGAFTSQETVHDIEALRQAGGYEKLVLQGVSYGTKVALDYAATYPQNVEALVLDSVVPPDGSEPLRAPSFQAIAPAMAELCEARACAGITSNPVADIARLVAAMRKRALHGSVYDGAGRRHSVSLDATGLFDTMIAGDLNPAVRALLPAAVKSALRHDPDPLLRLSLLAEGLIPSAPRAHASAAPAPELDEALYATTICEESPFPWSRSASPATRLAEASGYIHAQPAGSFYPFNASVAFEASALPNCASWPDQSPPPPSHRALPNVPTLILAGEQDLRTPASNARDVEAMIPDSQLLVVPFTGHSVIGYDLSHCSSNAVSAFFNSAPVQPCGPTANVFTPTPVIATKLTRVHPPATLRGRSGETLVAVLDTLLDLKRQIITATLQVNQELPSGASFGGLHGGYARLASHSVLLHDFSLVPGVQLTGTLPMRNGALQITTIHVSGAVAAAGTVRTGSSASRITGTLGGKRFSLARAKVRLSSSSAREWPSLATIRPLLARGAARLSGGSAAPPRLR
ncbi:MAG TPA: alpha/beta hydrolase [Solirubrobacteraceae bacterium]|nr:alpha/beta hydrolase [Solirubrobacteraceae bacterium]